LLINSLKGAVLPAEAQLEIENYRASIQNHYHNAHGTETNFIYKEPVIIERENKFKGFNFKTEQPIEFDKKQLQTIAMRGVSSHPQLY
jgi:hypothetical protein